MVDRSCRVAILVVLLAGVVLGGVEVCGPMAHAESLSVDLNSPEAVRQILELHRNKRVKLKLVSGQDIEGKVATVGTSAVVITELAGMEFFEATVRLDQVAAVVVRVQSK